MSWVMKWPDDGFKSSEVFNDLQYAHPDCRLRATNDIPLIELRPEATVLNQDTLAIGFKIEGRKVTCRTISVKCRLLFPTSRLVLASLIVLPNSAKHSAMSRT